MKTPTPAPRHAWENAPEELAFRFSDGAAARSLAELARAIRHVPAATVWYHREHFAPWIAGVVGDEPLARRFEHYSRAGGDAEVLRDTLADLVETRLAQLRAPTPGLA